jgi:hypothetical protein
MCLMIVSDKVAITHDGLRVTLSVQHCEGVATYLTMVRPPLRPCPLPVAETAPPPCRHLLSG